MWTTLNKVLVAVLLMMFLAYCGQQGEDIKPAPDTSVEDVWQNSVRITFLSQADLDRKCRELQCNPHGTARGFAGRDQQGRCLVYQLKPSRVDDDATLTLGHEILHCVYGKYHGEL